MTSYLAIAKQILTNHGLDAEYHCPRNTKGGGDCFFHALVDQLSDPEIKATVRKEVRGKSINSTAIRERVVDFARRNQDNLLGDETVLNMLESDEANAGGDRDVPTIWDEYLRDMRRPGEWATELIVKIAAIYFGKDIRAVKETYEAIWHGGNHAVDPPFVIVNMQEQHFQSVHRRGLNAGMEEQAGQREPNSQAPIKNPPRGARSSCSSQPAKPNTNVGKASSAPSSLEECKGCQRPFKQIRKHLAQAPKCNEHYDQEELKARSAELRKSSQAKYERGKGKERMAKYERAHRLERSESMKALRKIRFEETDESTRYKKFKAEIKEGLSYTCICCHRLGTKVSVRHVPIKGDIGQQLKGLQARLDGKEPGLFKACIHTPLKPCMKVGGKLWLCHTCFKDLEKFKKPKLRYCNGLQADEIPEALKLSDLEAVLIAKRILFLKIFNLPTSRWRAVIDRVVNVPIEDEDLLTTLNKVKSLPRMPGDAGLVPVTLKRKVEYKNKVIEAYIDPEKLQAAILKLKELGHPSYQDIAIDRDFAQRLEAALPDEEVEDSDLPVSDQDSDGADDQLHSVRKYQHDMRQATCMTDRYPEMSMVVNNTNKTMDKKSRDDSIASFPIAPGEGKIPTSLMRDSNWDVDAFPHLHPTGRYGLHHPRDQKLTSQKYFIQRLMNCDDRWVKNPAFLFSALYYLERDHLERQINISCQIGKVAHGRVIPLSDCFHIFDRIPGTFRYWQQKRYEVLARIHNLGEFQFFFTLSCADKRWPENKVSILLQRGLKVEFRPKSGDGFTDDDIFVEGQPLDEFLKNEDFHQMVRDNVRTITLNFNQRVKAFMKHIVMGDKNPMNVEYYNFRVEFQGRGAGHIHGTLWLDMEEIERSVPGIKAVFKKLKTGGTLLPKEQVTAGAFVDMFISCSSDIEGVSEIVEQVQVHRHTKTCYKRGKNCRFGFPRLPSEKTIIAQPLDKSTFSSEREFKAEVKERQLTLAKVKDVLLSLSPTELESLDVNGVLKRARVSSPAYYCALSTSALGISVVLKRQPKDIYVNNFNPEWIKAWDANMDLQVCMDQFAVVTYITDYYTKDESGMLQHLKDAKKEFKGGDRIEMARYMAFKFLTHRQMGEAEVFYRMLPHLHLSESNIKCKFQAGGFPWDRTKLLRPIDEDKLLQGEDEDDFLMEQE